MDFVPPSGTQPGSPSSVTVTIIDDDGMCKEEIFFVLLGNFFSLTILKKLCNHECVLFLAVKCIAEIIV